MRHPSRILLRFVPSELASSHQRWLISILSVLLSSQYLCSRGHFTITAQCIHSALLYTNSVVSAQCSLYSVLTILSAHYAQCSVYSLLCHCTQVLIISLVCLQVTKHMKPKQGKPFLAKKASTTEFSVPSAARPRHAELTHQVTQNQIRVVRRPSWQHLISLCSVFILALSGALFLPGLCFFSFSLCCQKNMPK